MPIFSDGSVFRAFFSGNASDTRFGFGDSVGIFGSGVDFLEKWSILIGKVLFESAFFYLFIRKFIEYEPDK